MCGDHSEVRPKEIVRRDFNKLAVIGSLGTVFLYYLSNPKPSAHYDYTFRVAENLIRGAIGFTSQPPSWLNEFVPFDGAWYSVFPFGSVVSMIPFALLKVAGIVDSMPGGFIASASAGTIFFLLLKIGSAYDLPANRIILTASGILFGTFVWANLTFAGAWQLALGFAMIGQLAALYFTLYDRRPILAGLFFALAFGNRTEVLLTAPIFFYFLSRKEMKIDEDVTEKKFALDISVDRLVQFCFVPFIIGVGTLVYNYVRFESMFDFGYARIPGVLDEPWYKHGIFSVWYIPGQAWEMLLRPWQFRDVFPYVTPNPFSSSIILSSPFLLFIFRCGGRDKALKYCAWAAIVMMTLLLWTHGNSGGWQFGYRYFMVCLPWVFMILLETAPKKITPTELAVYIFSFAVNAYATWLFHWTRYLTP